MYKVKLSVGVALAVVSTSSSSTTGVYAEELDLTKPQREILDKFWSEHEHDADVQRWDSQTYGNANYWNSLVAGAGSAALAHYESKSEAPPLQLAQRFAGASSASTSASTFSFAQALAAQPAVSFA